MVDRVVLSNPSRFQQGPAGAFIQRLHAIGWRWEMQGFIQDHEQFVWRLVHVPTKALHERLEHAWHRAIASQVCTRDTLEGLDTVDVKATFQSLKSMQPDHKGLMRAAMNGSFYARDKLVHTGKILTSACQWCGEQDSTCHRNWECEGFRACRPDQLTDLPLAARQTPCVAMKGWCVEPDAYMMFRRELCNQPDLTACFETIPPSEPEAFHLFTDGSTKDPAKPQIRLSTWALVCADLSDDTFKPCALGGVPGLIQTTLRAELTAVIAAFRYGIAYERVFYIWTDNQAVYDGVCNFDATTSISVFSSDHDLWQVLWMCWNKATALSLFAQITKIRSHQDPKQYPDLVEQWVIRGNDAADCCAGRARCHLPRALRQAHQRAVFDFQQQQATRDIVHKVLCAIGTQSVESKPARSVSDAKDWELVQRDHAPADMVSFSNLPDRLAEEGCGTLGSNASKILHWLRRLAQKEGTQLRWITPHELLVHYQACAGHVGFWYNTDTRCFEDAQEVFRQRDFDFLKMANWFQSALKTLAMQLGTHYSPQSRLPHSEIYKCWTRCLLMPILPGEHLQVGTWLRPASKGRVTSVRKAFSSLEACASLRF